MQNDAERSQYRALIDALVDECRNGQGKVLPGWVRRGIWSEYANKHPEEMPDEYRMNLLLTRLSSDDRDAVARMLELSYQGAVHDAIAVLHEREVPPFQEGYEGTPYQDFMGRLVTDWEWPSE